MRNKKIIIIFFIVLILVFATCLVVNAAFNVKVTFETEITMPDRLCNMITGG